MIHLDKSLLKASLIVSKTLKRRLSHQDLNPFIEPKTKEMIEQKNEPIANDHDHVKQKVPEHIEDFKPKSNLTPYILLIALSFHGFFEGIALGLQSGIFDTSFLFFAILSHKWAEAFTLGLSFYKSGTDKPSFIRMIILFSCFTPAGILLGIILSGDSNIIQGVFLALSTGTFIYIACSEVIVEEFAITRYKYSKFFAYLVGGTFIAGLAVIEKVAGVD